jgi:hypothetical protein
MKLTALIACSIALFAMMWTQAQISFQPPAKTWAHLHHTVTTNKVDTSNLHYDPTVYKLIANGEPEQLLLGMRMHGTKFLEVTWRDPHGQNKPQDVTIRTTYKPVITQDGGAWKITFEKD